MLSLAVDQGLTQPFGLHLAATVTDRIAEADGSPRDWIVNGLAIQEPLVGDADTSVITHRESLPGPREPR